MTETREGYRLSDEDLNRLINTAGAANELSWAVKDLLLAHYELEETAELKAENARLSAELRTESILAEEYSARVEGLEKSLQIALDYFDTMSVNPNAIVGTFAADAAKHVRMAALSLPKTNTE